MKKRKKIVALILFTSLIALSFIGCNDSIATEPLTIVSGNNSGDSWTNSYLRCDSVQMESTTTAYVWINGTKMKVVADELRVYSN